MTSVDGGAARRVRTGDADDNLDVPGIIQVGVPKIAHLFVFDFAMLSAITLPVAVAVGARIVEADSL